MILRHQLRNRLWSVFWPQDRILFSRSWTVPSGLVPRVSCLIASSLSMIINFFCGPSGGLLFFYSSCLLQDTNPHRGNCRSTQPHISNFLLDITQGHLLQTQDHPDNFHSSFWGSFTSEPITSPTIPSTENQSYFLLTPVTSSSQFQVLNGSDCVPSLCYCCHHSSWHTPLLSE